MEQVNKNILLAIDCIDKVIKEENFAAYHNIKKELNEALDLAIKSHFIESEKSLSKAFRLLMEAPPRNQALGEEVLTKMDIAYNSLKELID